MIYLYCITYNAASLLIIMNFPVILCLLLLHFSIAYAGTGPRDGRIIGGYDASPRSHPYLVSLQMRFLWARMRLCSGSLLSERWILTAGHCVKGSWIMNWLTMEAVVGTIDIENKESTSQTVKISERIPHPNYEGGLGAYDIGMVKTAKRIQYTSAVAPIEVPLSMGSFTHRTQNLILAGWGVLETTTWIPSLSDKLQEAQIEYLPFDECSKAIDAVKENYEDNPLDRVANICTGPITGGIAACSGDSGGPLIQYISYNAKPTTELATESATISTSTIDGVTYNTSENTTQASETISPSDLVNNELGAIEDKEDRNKREGKKDTGIVQTYKEQGLIPVVIGVVSWGISPCGEVGAPTVYTNVSTYADFIFKHLYNEIIF